MARDGAASVPPEVTLSAPEESVAVISFTSIPAMVTTLSVESKYAYAALCARALDRCRFSLSEVTNEGKDDDETDVDSVTLRFHRDVLRDVIHHVGLTLEDVWASLSAVMGGTQVTTAPFIETLKKELMESNRRGRAASPSGSATVPSEIRSSNNGDPSSSAASSMATAASNSYPALSFTHSTDDDFSGRGGRNLSLPLQQQQLPSTHSLLQVPGSHCHVPLSPVHNSRNFCLLFFIQDLLTLAVQDTNGYDARWRVFIKEFALLIHVNADFVDDIEESYILYLRTKGKRAAETNSDDDAAASDRQFKRKATRYLKIGLATAIGGTLVGMTGGLAAPFIAAGTGAFIGTAGAAVIGSGAGLALIGTGFGVGGAGLIGYRMKRRVGVLEQFEFEPLVDSHANVDSLHVGIAIAGWLNSDAEDSFKVPWVNLMLSKEQYALKWEGKYLLELGQSLEYLLHVAMQKAGIEALKYTVLSGVMSAVAWPVGILALSHAIDNPWSVCMNRSTLAGKQLAHVLLSREQGKRPVSLIGFSLGARVIYSCLEELLLVGGRSYHQNPFGIVENIVILGAPLPGDAESWRHVSHVVAGRIINGYCRSDWMLKFLYRTSSGNTTIAGLRPIEMDLPDSFKILNFDLTDIVSGHTDYACKVGEILKTLGLETNWTAILSRSNSRSSINSIHSDPSGGLSHCGGSDADSHHDHHPISQMAPSISTPSNMVAYSSSQQRQRMVGDGTMSSVGLDSAQYSSIQNSFSNVTNTNLNPPPYQYNDQVVSDCNIEYASYPYEPSRRRSQSIVSNELGQCADALEYLNIH